MSTEPGDTGRVTHDAESKLWVQQLRSGHPRHEEAVGKLRGVLVGIAFDELSRRRGQLGAPAGPEDDELAQQAADAALMNIPGERLEQREQLEALSAAIAKLGDRQREVFVAVALNDVSVDVLALQLDSNRAETYKHLFDARRTLRKGLAAAGHAVLEESASA